MKRNHRRQRLDRQHCLRG